MNRPTFRPDPRRDAAAAELAAGAYCWPVVTLKRDVNAFRAGEVFYGVPSSDGVNRYLATSAAGPTSRSGPASWPGCACRWRPAGRCWGGTAGRWLPPAR